VLFFVCAPVDLQRRPLAVYHLENQRNENIRIVTCDSCLPTRSIRELFGTEYRRRNCIKVKNLHRQTRQTLVSNFGPLINVWYVSWTMKAAPRMLAFAHASMTRANWKIKWIYNTYIQPNLKLPNITETITHLTFTRDEANSSDYKCACAECNVRTYHQNMRATFRAHLILVDLITLVIYNEAYKLWSPSLCSLLQPSATSCLFPWLHSPQLRPWPPPQNPAEFLGGFSTIFFVQGRIISSTPNLHPGGPGLCIYIPQRQCGYPF
jgi:hypothetical protein